VLTPGFDNYRSPFLRDAKKAAQSYSAMLIGG